MKRKQIRYWPVGPYSEAAYIPELADPQGEVGQGGFLLTCVR
jgi:hypothetical protein